MLHSLYLAAIATVLLCPWANADGLYSKSSAVLQVDGKSYDKLIKKSNMVSIVEFYAPWCGHCKNLKPAYEKAAKSLDGLAQVAAINCDEESNKAFCGSMGVKGFPTIKTVRPTLKLGKPIVQDYQGGRTAKDIVEAVKSLIPNHVKRVTDKDFSGWLKENNETAKAVLFSNKGTTSALIKVLATDFYGNMHFGQVRDRDTEAVSTFGVTTFPTLVVLPGGEAPAVTYTGPLEKIPMKAFLGVYAKPATSEPVDSKAGKQKPLKEEKLKNKKSSGSKSSSDSSAFSEASAAHASGEASEAAASPTAITLEESGAPTESPDPKVVPEDAPVPIIVADAAPQLSTLETQEELQGHCLGPKTPACILALLTPVADAETIRPESETAALARLSEIALKHKTRGDHLFPFYAVPASNPAVAQLSGALGLKDSEVQLIAVNRRRGWWRHFNSEKGYGMMEVEGWVDGIRLGEGKKQKLPEELIVENVEEQVKEVPVEGIQEEKPVETETGAEETPAEKVEEPTSTETEEAAKETPIITHNEL